ncbi:hypothetical protein PVAND_008596 [Polypedilum vanderplanki]|uniref:HTH La-type RNA-binding domain-containing protein n=1 Tax=Polypedilum vanderplanki TaxID=319348 RepID=A0A9J6CA98_POLVA|nr:hypothetical protein PVAND_008596 [Polypedilum vanderplanki]
MSVQNTNEEINTKALDDSMSSRNNNLNESMTVVVGIEMQSTLETNESESTPLANVLDECDSIQNLRPSTSAASDTATSSSNNDSLDNSGDEGIGDEQDSASNNTDVLDDTRFRAIDLQPKIKVAVADEIPIPTDINEDELDSDTLSPLVIDNHVYVEHCEMMKHANREIPGIYDHFDDEFEEVDDVTSTSPPRSVFLKCPNTKDSFSSTDSDVSFSYESKQSANEKMPDNQHHLDPNSLSDDNKDSGCDLKNKNNGSSDEDAPIEIPDDDFCEKIVEQVEFYFSNESLLKDAFLLKHVRRNKEGFVSLKLVSSFKRVRALTKDWRVKTRAIASL